MLIAVHKNCSGTSQLLDHLSPNAADPNKEVSACGIIYIYQNIHIPSKTSCTRRAWFSSLKFPLKALHRGPDRCQSCFLTPVWRGRRCVCSPAAAVLCRQMFTQSFITAKKNKKLHHKLLSVLHVDLP